MDRKRGLLNVSVSIMFKLIIFVSAIFHRRFLIQCVGNEINGLNSLYSSLLGMLSVAELGIGGAIVYCMYKPIVEGNKAQVAALYQLFKKVYYVIGLVIFTVGAALLPLLPYLAKDYSELDVNVYVSFLLTLVTVCMTYLFSTKLSLINAYKNNYITTTINSGCVILQYIIQIVVLLLTRSYMWYLICAIPIVFVQWIVTELVSRRMHGEIIAYEKQALDPQIKSQVLRNVKAMFAHRIGGILVNSADSMIISAFIGVVLLGKYTNYTTIVTNMTALIALLFSPLTSIIGHMYVEEKEQIQKYYHFFHAFNFAIGAVFYLGYYAVADSLVAILFGEGLEMAKAVSFVITVNYFVQFVRQVNLLFRDATGTFYQDRWKPYVEGTLNVVLSILLVLLFKAWFGEEFGIVGVIAATIVTNLAICHVVEPYVIYKHAFHAPMKKQMLKNYLYIGIFVVALLMLDRCMFSIENLWLELLVNGCISVGFSAVLILAMLALDRNFRCYVKVFLKRLFRRA